HDQHERRRGCVGKTADGLLAEKCGHAIPSDSPRRPPQHFRALAAVELVQELVEIFGRRLFVTFQPKKFLEFVVVQHSVRCCFSETPQGGPATAGVRKKAAISQFPRKCRGFWRFLHVTFPGYQTW